MTQLKLAVFALSLLFSVASAQAQLSTGGTPISFLFPSIAQQTVPVIEMPGVDVQALLREDADNALSLEKRLRFGQEMSVQINPDNSGIKDILPGGDKIWRVGIKSSGAKTINFIFSKYKLPPGAQLFIYNADHSEIIGAFTDANNQENEQLGTTLVNGDAMVVEYYEPARAKFQGQVEIGTVVHGYRTPGVTGSGEIEERGFGDSGGCNINVHCTLGNGWGAQKRSVVRIINGGDWCSGAMINNTNNNGVPYLLTANHCYDSNIGNWVFWFNWQAPNCPNPSSSPAHNSRTGSSLKARRAASDFCLLRLNSAPPAAWNVFYSGWNRSSTAPTQETCIHHPSGDIKKISRDNNTATNGSEYGSDHWRVYWDQGVTEGGSSGSPLYDQNKRIVGQLHGGASACGNSSSNMWDEYGKFSVSWNSGTSSSSRLRDWLDPGNTGATTNNGYDPPNSLHVEGSNGNVSGDPGEYSYEVLGDIHWQAVSLTPWLKVSESNPAAGLLSVQFDRNAATQTRTGIVQLTGEDGAKQFVTLTQFGNGSQSTARSVEEETIVYPNPTTGVAVVDIKENGKADIAIFDVNGRMILQMEVQNRAELDLTNEPNGFYFVRITLNEKTTTLRLVVQK